MQQLHVSVCRASGLRALPDLQARVMPSSLNAGSSSARVGPVRAYSKQPYCHIKPHRSPMVGHITNRSACLVVFNDAPPQCSTGPRVLLLHALPRGSQGVSAMFKGSYSTSQLCIRLCAQAALAQERGSIQPHCGSADDTCHPARFRTHSAKPLIIT